MFHLSIITPERIVFEGEVKSLTAPAATGYIEILTNHSPFIALLQPGKMTITPSPKERLDMAVSGGFLEFSRNVALLLADAVELISDIDFERAQQAFDRAQELIRHSPHKTDVTRTIEALHRAKNRMHLSRPLINK